MSTGISRECLDELLCIADSNWVLGHWYIKVMLNGRSLPDCTAFAGMGQDSLGHTRAIFRFLEDQLDLPEHQLEFGRAPEELHNMEVLSSPPQNWGDFLVTALLAESAIWRLLSTFLDSQHAELAGMVKHFGKELYFHRLSLEGWIAATDEEERRDMQASLRARAPLIAPWFTEGAGADPLQASGVRTVSVTEARGGFVTDVLEVLTGSEVVAPEELETLLAPAAPDEWDAARRKPLGAAVPATLWEFMIPTDEDTKALRRPLTVSVDDNLDLVDRAEYGHADFA